LSSDMLVETLDYAVDNREEILSRLDFGKHSSIIEKARANWVGMDSVTPGPGLVTRNLAGIDSSWNFLPYQGFYIYAVDAVTMLEDGSCLVPPLFEVNIDTLAVKVGEGTWVSSPALALESIGMEYEFEQAKAAVGKADMILIDGSILARFYDRRGQKDSAYYEYAKELMKEKDGDVLFISKTSYSNVTLNGALGDMFYYNRVSSKPGYSQPYLDRSGVTITYARLTEYSPCLKLEAPGEIKNKEIQEMIEILREGSVDGYPYVLRLAHERGKVSHDEMEKLANLLGLNTELGGREVLGE
jgi:hypothetical protein